MSSDFTGSGFRFNEEEGLVECEEGELKELEKRKGEKVYCCQKCKDKALRIRAKVEEVRLQKSFVEIDRKHIPITALEGLYFQPHCNNEQMMRVLTQQVQFNTKPINFFELQGALQSQI